MNVECLSVLPEMYSDVWNKEPILNPTYRSHIEKNPELYQNVITFLEDRDTPNTVGSKYIRYELSCGYGMEQNRKFILQISYFMSHLGYIPPRYCGGAFRLRDNEY